MTDEEHKIWNSWKDNSIVLNQYQLNDMLNTRYHSKKLLREHFYRVGIQPNEFMLKRVDNTGKYWRSYSTTREYEIRFASPELLAYLKLSGLV